MGWFIAAFILIGLAMLPLRLVLLYNEDGFFTQARIGPFKFLLYPGKPRKKGKKKSSPKHSDHSTHTSVKTETVKKSGGKLLDFYPLARVILLFLNDLRKKLTVSRLEFKIILAGGDPCDLAINYGRSWAALSNLMPQLERFLDIRKRDLQIECDFTGLEPTIYGFADIKISLGRSLLIAVPYGIKALKEFISIKNTRKGGAQV